MLRTQSIRWPFTSDYNYKPVVLTIQLKIKFLCTIPLANLLEFLMVFKETHLLFVFACGVHTYTKAKQSYTEILFLKKGKTQHKTLSQTSWIHSCCGTYTHKHTYTLTFLFLLFAIMCVCLYVCAYALKGQKHQIPWSCSYKQL